MENTYGIGITNRYQLFLDEDEDPLEVLKVQEQEKELKKKTKLSEKENKGKQQESKGKATVNARKGIKETQNIKSQDQQHKVKEDVKVKGPARAAPERKFNTENREERNNQRNRSEKPAAGPGIGGDFHREERGDRADRFDRGDRPDRGDRVDRGERFDRGDRFERGDRPDRGERRFERRPVADGDGGPREGGRGRGMGLGRGMGRGRGRGGRGGFDGRGKREFDRQSGSDKTGIKAVDKRDGAGAHNWGSHKDALDDLDNVNRQTDDSGEWGEKPENDVSLTEPSGDNKEVTEGQNGVEGEEGETPGNLEEERKELTLDEWKALKGTRSKPQYNLRKAGEGEDLSQWKKMYALEKKKELEEEEDDEEYDLSVEYPQRVGRQKHVLDIEFTFADTRMGGGRGRGGRGGGRGAPRGAPRGGPRGSSSDNAPRDREREPGSFRQSHGPNRQSAPKVDDEHDFPSLG